MPQSQATLRLFKILVMVSPVIMGAIIYYVLTEFTQIGDRLAAIIAFGVAASEWLVFTMLIKKLEARVDQGS